MTTGVQDVFLILKGDSKVLQNLGPSGGPLRVVWKTTIEEDQAGEKGVLRIGLELGCMAHL